MKPRDLEVMFAAPIFVFLGIFLFILSLGSIFETMATSPDHLLLGCILFILSFNCFRVGLYMIRR